MSLEKLAKALTIGGYSTILSSVAFMGYKKMCDSPTNDYTYEFIASGASLASIIPIFTGFWISTYNKNNKIEGVK